MLHAPGAAPGGRDVLRQDVATYYAGRLAAHGPTPPGVDWACQPTQELRFVQLLKLCDFSEPFSINDLGCGYGALRTFIRTRCPGTKVDYRGIDLVPAMIDEAQRLWQRQPDAHFACASDCGRVADYSVASGIFNVKLDQTVAAWEAFVRETLADLHASSSRGFAVNFLRRLPGVETVPQLYRAAPADWARYCEQELGMTTELRESYGMREFTLLARK